MDPKGVFMLINPRCKTWTQLRKELTTSGDILAIVNARTSSVYWASVMGLIAYLLLYACFLGCTLELFCLGQLNYSSSKYAHVPLSASGNVVCFNMY